MCGHCHLTESLLLLQPLSQLLPANSESFLSLLIKMSSYYAFCCVMPCFEKYIFCCICALKNVLPWPRGVFVDTAALSLLLSGGQHVGVTSLHGAKDASQLPLGPLSMAVSNLRYEGSGSRCFSLNITLLCQLSNIKHIQYVYMSLIW